PGARRVRVDHDAAGVERPVVPAHPGAGQGEPDRRARRAAVHGAVRQRLAGAARCAGARRGSAHGAVRDLLAAVHPGAERRLRQMSQLALPPIVQLAIDSMDEDVAASLVTRAAASGADWIELGRPLLDAVGFAGLERLVRLSPNSTF